MLRLILNLTDVKDSLFLVLMRELYNDHCLQSDSLDVHHGTITCSVSLYATTAGVTLSPASFATTSARPSYMKTITRYKLYYIWYGLSVTLLSIQQHKQNLLDIIFCCRHIYVD